jgi:hypothetical protein
MSIPYLYPQFLGFFLAPIVIEPSACLPSGEAVLLLIRQFDERIRLSTRAVARDDAGAV